MKLNREALFLCTCLAAFDTLFLLNNLCSRQIVLFGYFLGFGDLRNTRYRYADLYLMRSLLRFSGTCSCRTIVLLTQQKWVHSPCVHVWLWVHAIGYMCECVCERGISVSAHVCALVIFVPCVSMGRMGGLHTCVHLWTRTECVLVCEWTVCMCTLCVCVCVCKCAHACVCESTQLLPSSRNFEVLSSHLHCPLHKNPSLQKSSGEDLFQRGISRNFSFFKGDRGPTDSVQSHMNPP